MPVWPFMAMTNLQQVLLCFVKTSVRAMQHHVPVVMCGISVKDKFLIKI